MASEITISDQDRAFLRVCEDVRQGSHDPDRQVGAVVISPDGMLLGFGSNAPPARLSLSVEQSHAAIRADANWKYFFLEHAERNAIFAALLSGKSTANATIYTTLFPCADCARAIVASGISRLVVRGAETKSERDGKWLEHYRNAERIFALANVPVLIIPPACLSDKA
jgi:dCMP deaminase